MQYRHSFMMFFIQHRYIHCSSVNLKNYFARQSRFMKRMLNNDQSKRKWYKETITTTMPSNFILEKPEIQCNNRRMNVLNKLFMEYITDLMSTGEVASKLVGKGIEISQVKVTPRFDYLRVYWITKGDVKHDNEIEQVLHSSAGHIRHELTQLRIVGIVPVITFVKDKRFSFLAEVESKLTIADFGDDFTPTTNILKPAQESILHFKLSPHIRSKLKDIETSEENKDNEFVINLPPMRCDVFGLNQFNIMSRVQQSMKKSHGAAQSRLNSQLPDSHAPITMNSFKVADYLTAKEDKEAFSKFLVQRIIDEKHKKRRERSKMNLQKLDDINVDNTEDYNVDESYDTYNDDYSDEIELEKLK
ncbi:uncharacterized protein LOC107272176 [Cephus cinctus]|uniref:Uncharacterized protein LOC107272176 n=1 Tax=Cephus cinctus TaxID=211228 RepID=A0AAJ7FRG3_CEPCN|nr:uncharacterized protein LOC107272176 [Cephus cinctus]